MNVYNAPNVQSGDILLYRVAAGSTWLDKLIGWGQKIIHQAPTNAEYCHVALVGPLSNWLYEAHWPKIRNVLIDWVAMTRRNTVEAYRVKDITPEQIKKVMIYADKRVGEWYGLLTILTFGIFQFGPSAVCSQYVWECFTAADIALCEFENLESPDDLAASKRLVRVT